MEPPRALACSTARTGGMAGTGGAGTGALALGAADQPAGAQHPPGDHVRHAHRAEIEVDLVAELFPEVMGLAATLVARSEEHTSELQSLIRISYAVFCLNKKKRINS